MKSECTRRSKRNKSDKVNSRRSKKLRNAIRKKIIDSKSESD